MTRFALRQTRLATLLAAAVAIMAPPAQAQSAQLLDDVFAICQNLAAGPEKTHTSATAAGWIKEDDPRQAYLALASLTMARDFAYRSEKSASRGRDVSGPQALYQFILMNGPFMAASVLGNSALKQGQPTYTQGGFGLSTMGLAQDTPYCLLNGPAPLYDAFLAHGELLAPDKPLLPEAPLRAGAELAHGQMNRMTVFASQIDLDLLDRQATAAGETFDPEFKSQLPVTSIQLMPLTDP